MDDVLKRVEELLARLEKQVDMPRQEWYSINQAAAYCGLSPKHVRRAVVGGMLPVSNVGTPNRALYRVSRIDLEGWLQERKAGPKPPRGRKKKGAEAPYVSRHCRGPASRPSA